MATLTLPASCSAIWWGVLAGETGKSLRRGVKCPQIDGKLAIDDSCSPAQNPSISPVCPVGWSSAAASETATICCPSLHRLSNSVCASPLGFDSTVALSECPTNNSTPFPTSAEFGGQYVVFVSRVVITPVQTSTTSTVSSTSERKFPLASSSQVPNSNTATADTPSPSSLSKGAIAGTVIGAVAFLALLLLAVYLLLRRRKQKTLENPVPAMHTNGTYADTQPDLVATSAFTRAAPGYDPSKRQSTNAISELHSGIPTRYPTTSFSEPPSELPTTTDGNFAGMQPHAHMAGDKVGSTSLHDAQHIRNAGPHYPQI